MTESILATALSFAEMYHRGQRRKGTTIPYVSHLMAVAALALEGGGTKELHAPAALLHDVVEDTGASVTDIKKIFGPDIAAIVKACSDASDPKNKDIWPRRKARYIRHLEKVSPDALLVSLADKVHNASAILSDYEQLGPKLWKRFKPESEGASGQLWYYRRLLEAFEARRRELVPGGRRLLDRLGVTVRTLQALVTEREPAAVGLSYNFGRARKSHP